jgi:hypothetical protein
LSFFSVIRHTDRPVCPAVPSCAVIVLVAVAAAVAVPLENWRLPFFKIAADFEQVDGAPSRMFWDDIESAALFDSSLWNSCSREGINYWHIEPNVTGGYGYPVEDKPFFLHTDIFHEARYYGLLFRQSLDVDSRYRYDPFYPAHSDRFTQGVMEEALLQFDWKYGFLKIGRQKRNWGPFPDRSLVLSSNPYAYDAVEWQVTGSFFEFRHLFAPFPFEKAGKDTDNGSRLDRYLTAHSLNLIFGKWATFGVTEAVVFTRAEGFPDLQYINPVSIYTVVNTNREGNGNLMLGIQWNIHPFTDAVSLRGQLMLDDFQVDNEKETDKEPAHWGIDAGIYWYNPLRFLHCQNLLKLEVAHLSEWIYTVPDENADRGERFIYGGKSLGFAMNDGTSLRFEGVVVPGTRTAARLAFTYHERGGNNERSRWHDRENIPGLPVSVHRPVERRFAVGAGGAYYFKGYLNFTGYGDLGWIQNKGNSATDSYSFDPSVRLELSIHYSDFFARLP